MSRLGSEAWLRITQSYWIITRHWEVSLPMSFNSRPGTRSFKGVPEQFDVLSCTELSQYSLAPTNPRERASAGDTDYWANQWTPSSRSLKRVNNPTLTEFCFSMIGRADIDLYTGFPGPFLARIITLTLA